MKKLADAQTVDDCRSFLYPTRFPFSVLALNLEERAAALDSAA